MASEIIAANHLAMEPVIKDRLRADLAGVTVGGLLEYLAFLDGDSAALPAVFVVYDGDRLNSGQGSPHQAIVSQSWQVVIVTAPPRAQDGDMDLSEAGSLMAMVIRALSGVRLQPGLKPLARGDDTDGMRYGNGMLFAFLSFAQPLDMR